MLPPGAFRLLLAAVVVVHHSFPLRLGAWAVGMFFVLSGYWIARMWRIKYCQQDSSYLTFLVSRWWRLSPLFFAIHGIAVLVRLLQAPQGITSVLSEPVWWLLQPLIAGSAQFGTLLPPAWSLDTEMQFYLVAPLLVAGIGVLKKQEQLMFLLAITLWSFIRLIGPSGLSTPQLDLFLWLFLVGVLSDQFKWSPQRWLALTSCVLAASIAAAVILLPATRSLLWQRGADAVGGSESIGGEVLYYAMCLFGIPLAISTVHQPSGKWDRWLGDLSYPLYLFHWIPRDWYYANTDWSRPAWYNAGLLLANFGIAFAGAIVLLYLVDRPAQQMRNRWIQSKHLSDASKPPNNTTVA